MILRKIARCVRAWLVEPSDPAVDEALELVREGLREYHLWRQEGLGRGWQP